MGEIVVRDPVLLRPEKAECGTCGGTGIGGAAVDYVQGQAAGEHEAEHRRNRELQQKVDE
jgi:hypothetical protein